MIYLDVAVIEYPNEWNSVLASVSSERIKEFSSCRSRVRPERELR